MNELTQAVATTVIEIDHDLAVGYGFSDGWTAWTICPNGDDDGYHLHRQGEEAFFTDSIYPYAEEWINHPLPPPMIGVILAYAIQPDEDAGVFVGRVTVAALRDGTLLILNRINDQKPRLQIAGPNRGIHGPGMTVPAALRTHVTNPTGQKSLLGLIRESFGPDVLIVDTRMFEEGGDDQ